jgi:ABC-type glycerol-3-phosphate transport system substrate-binding protein
MSRLIGGAAAITLLLAACGSPGSSGETSSPSASEPAPTAAPTLPSGPQQLVIVDQAWGENQGQKALAAAFMKQYPNVTVTVKDEPFDQHLVNLPRKLAADDPGDLVRVVSVGDSVVDGLLEPLDQYYDAFGWSKFPDSAFASWRVADDGRSRGSGKLYAAPLGFGFVGVYYNKDLAAKVNMSVPPTTVEEMEAVMDRAKANGIIPAVVPNKEGWASWPYQWFIHSTWGKENMNGWAYRSQGAPATLETPEVVAAGDKLKEWVDKGYLSTDINGIDQSGSVEQFKAGNTLFLLQGTWWSLDLFSTMKDKVGFTLFPSYDASKGYATMAAPTPYAMPAKAKNKEVAAFYLNWMMTDPEALKIADASASIPLLPIQGTTVIPKEVLDAWAVLVKDDGLVEFINNATPSMLQTGAEQLQSLVAGKESAADVAAGFQKDYDAAAGS